jgi:hypothetical protein
MSLADAIPGVSQAKAIIGGIMVAGVLGFALWGMRVNHLRAEHLNDLHAAQAWQANVQSATSHAAGVSGLIALDQVPVQISYLGQAVSDLNGKVAEQNVAIDNMVSASAAKIAAGNAALAKVEQGRAAAEKAVSALRTSAAGNAGNAGACVPSAAFLANSGVL